MVLPILAGALYAVSQKKVDQKAIMQGAVIAAGVYFGMKYLADKAGELIPQIPSISDLNWPEWPGWPEFPGWPDIGVSGLAGGQPFDYQRYGWYATDPRVLTPEAKDVISRLDLSPGATPSTTQELYAAEQYVLSDIYRPGGYPVEAAPAPWALTELYPQAPPGFPQAPPVPDETRPADSIAGGTVYYEGTAGYVAPEKPDWQKALEGL